jgi:hypothetical protein
MVDQDGNSGLPGKKILAFFLLDTLAPEYTRHPLPSLLSGAERANPVVACLFNPDSKPTARLAQLHCGTGMVPEANATRRKARGIHNPVDRASAHAERRLTGTK